MQIEINVTPRKIERLIFLVIILGLIGIIIYLSMVNSCKTEATEKNQTEQPLTPLTPEPEPEQPAAEPEPKNDTRPETPAAGTATCTPKFKCIDDYHTVWINADCTIDRKKGSSCLDGCKDGKCLEG